MGEEGARIIIKIRLVSHASVIVDCGDARIWTDPWLISKAFNNSWTLWPPASCDRALLDNIDWIWLSHEHPDHMNFPTLASLPDAFKKRVTILFQDNESPRIFEPLRGIGYHNFQVLHHRRIVPITSATKLYCYRVGTIDSCLAILNGGETVFNANDVRLNRADARRIIRDIGPSDVVLNQFSTAVYRGLNAHSKYLPIMARHMLETLSADHHNLRAKTTIPFASFMYFSTTDNSYMNSYANRVHDVVEYCAARGQKIEVLYPGDEMVVNEKYDSAPALAKFEKLYAEADHLSYDRPQEVSLDEIARSFHAFVDLLHQRYPRMLLSVLRPLRVKVPDLGKVVRLSIRRDEFEELADNAVYDVVIYSQPLHYCFVYPWGLHTLTSSARLVIQRNVLRWKMHKGLFALNNASVYLRPRFLLGLKNVHYAVDRIRGAIRYTDRTRTWTRLRRRSLSRPVTRAILKAEESVRPRAQV